MGGLLAGSAPLRGRSALELLVAPFVADDVPASRDDFDNWVSRTVLNPAIPLLHPLNVLEDAGLIAREADPFHARRSLFRIAEPLIT
jgi:uncharacterized protein